MTKGVHAGVRPTVKSVRRRAAGVIAVAGLIDLLSSATPPFRSRLELLVDLIPLAVPRAATALVTLAGLALILLSRGIRHGQNRAWRVAVALLGGSVILHLIKGVDLEEAAVAAFAAAYLIRHRRVFGAASDTPSSRFALLGLVAAVTATVAGGTLAIEVFHGAEPRTALPTAMAAVAERLAGVTSTAIPGGVDDFLSPALSALGLGLLAVVGWLLFRPVVQREPRSDSTLVRARSVVEQHGTDSLAYFALRDDKHHFFHGESLVAYAVIAGTCLVSPDPIGPDWEREEAWSAFRDFADSQGWSVAVLGASAGWVATYRDSGMNVVYVGDEGVVNISRFNLQGGSFKSLRQAVNRVARHGYSVSFFDPSRLPPELEGSLMTLMTRSRRGSVERGFSMTLGRVFDPRDAGLLLAVAFDAEDRPVAFCQYVSAKAIDGYSLDLMRRDKGEHPNGLIDFLIVGTIEHLREQGMTGLALNFATMRAVMAGETGEGWSPRVQRWILSKLSKSMQIESLRHFNGKYDPDWHPRWAAYDGPEHVLPAALAVAKAESFWELPLVGRFLAPGPAGARR